MPLWRNSQALLLLVFLTVALVASARRDMKSRLNHEGVSKGLDERRLCRNRPVATSSLDSPSSTVSSSAIIGSPATSAPQSTSEPTTTQTPFTSSSSSTSYSSAASASTSAPPLTPNGIKAGIAGGDAYPFMKDHIGWWYDWTPNPSKEGRPIGVPMLWGGGTADSTDARRFSQFKNLKTVPTYVLGYEEPDCASGSGSAGMSVSAGVSDWESLVAPLGEKGALLGSPSMCKQADETWLREFSKQTSTNWDFTAIHVNKNNLEGVKEDIDYYWKTYGRPIWVTEFACVNDVNGFTPCTDQAEINSFINTVVPHFQENEHVFAYAYSNGLGLGSVWPLMDGDSLSESGKTYLAAISEYH